MIKAILSLVAITLTFYAFFLYVRSILNDKTKPHFFSWVIWGMTTCIVFLAQLSDGGGVGAWPIGVSGIITLGIAGLAYSKRKAISITRTDGLFFSLALLSLPVWYFTTDALWAVILLTTIELLGFAPTFRKSYYLPFSESLSFIVLMGLRNVLSILALEHYSLTTVLFPATVALVCMVFIVMLILRRRYIQINRSTL